MNPQLTSAIVSARGLSPDWSERRASHVFRSALDRRETRKRRLLAVATGAGLLIVMVLRASSGAEPHLRAETGGLAPQPSALVAAHTLDDGGFARD